MKSYIIPLLMLLCSISTTAFAKNFSKLDKEQRTEYLINLAKEVTKNFGPEWYNLGPVHAVIDDTLAIFKDNPNPPREQIQKNIGRKYYRVKLFYDKATKERVIYTRASSVDIWADDGEPKSVFFGNSYGRNFFFISYREWLKMGVQEEDQTKYVKIDLSTRY